MLVGMSTTYPSDLSDAEWVCVQRYLPPLSTRGRPRTHPLRRILDAIFYVLRTGCAWRYLPSNFPAWPTVYYHFRRFRLQGPRVVQRDEVTKRQKHDGNNAEQ
jgi:putative transposase